jgi:hypothetical protein
MTLITETVLNAFKRGHITSAQYLAEIAIDSNDGRIITIDYDEHKYETYAADLHILKRDPNSYVNLYFDFNGNGSEIADNVKSYRRCDFEGQIIKATILLDRTGSIAIDVWKKSTFPPADGESITASAVPTVSSGVSSENTTLTGWTKLITAGDYLIANVDSCTTTQQATLILTIIPSTLYERIV